jgi:hypothetical protein
MEINFQQGKISDIVKALFDGQDVTVQVFDEYGDVRAETVLTKDDVGVNGFDVEFGPIDEPHAAVDRIVYKFEKQQPAVIGEPTSSFFDSSDFYIGNCSSLTINHPIEYKDI